MQTCIHKIPMLICEHPYLSLVFGRYDDVSLVLFSIQQTPALFSIRLGLWLMYIFQRLAESYERGTGRQRL